MSYRDSLDASQARAEALEAEVARLKAELAHVQTAPPPAPPVEAAPGLPAWLLENAIFEALTPTASAALVFRLVTSRDPTTLADRRWCRVGELVVTMIACTWTLLALLARRP